MSEISRFFHKRQVAHGGDIGFVGAEYPIGRGLVALVAAFGLGAAAANTHIPAWSELFSSQGGDAATGGQANQAPEGGAPALTAAPPASHSTSPSPAASRSSAPAIAPSEIRSVVPTTTSPAKPAGKKVPTTCDIGKNDITFNVGRTQVTVDAGITGNDPNPAESYLVFDQGEASGVKMQARLGLDAPVTLKWSNRPITVYYVHPSQLSPDNRPAPGTVNASIDPIFMGSGALYGICGGVTP